MRVLVAGATGAIGRPLVHALQGRGHTVVGLTRDPEKIDLLVGLGAEPVVADVLDAAATDAAVRTARPDVVVDQLTALPRHYTPQTMRAATAAAWRLSPPTVRTAVVAATAARIVWGV